MKTVVMVLPLWFALWLPASGQPQRYDVNSSKGTLPSPPQPPQFDLNSVPVGARQQLLPLYKQEYALLQQLSAVKWQALADTLSGLGSIGAALVAQPTAPTNVGEESAARAGQYGAQNRGVNAALDAQEPAEMYSSVDQAMKLLVQIGALEKRISSVQQSYGIDPKVRSPWSALFTGSSQLTPEGVTTLLLPAAKEAAKAVQADGYGDFNNLTTALQREMETLKKERQSMERSLVSCGDGCMGLPPGSDAACISRCNATWEPRIAAADQRIKETTAKKNRLLDK
jgi:hypothetical protein